MATTTLRNSSTRLLRGSTNVCHSHWRCRQTRCLASAASPAVITEQPHQELPPIPDSSYRPRLAALKDARPFSSFLTDTFDRQHDYLRISITERCNLRCLYCMPEEGVSLSPKEHLMTVPEILYLSSLFVSQGVNKIRLTGGEPTVHPQILPLLKDIGSLRTKGLKELAITSNGLTLARKLDAMVEAGVTGINLSLDTLDPFQFEIMTRRRGFEQVMKSIERILEMRKAGVRIKLKVNAVVIRGLNDHQVLPFVEFVKDKDMEVRFTEYMPFDGNRWSSKKMLSYQEMLAIIRDRYPGTQRVQDHPNDTSKTFQIAGSQGRIGFITSMTDHFCGSCNRLRITSDGNLKVCLFGNSEVSLRDMLRNNFNNGLPIDEAAWEALKQVEMDRREGRVKGEVGLQQKEMDLLNVIGMAVKRKKEKHAGLGELEHMKNRPMILIDSKSNKANTASLPRRSAWSSIPTHLLHSPQALRHARFFSTSTSRSGDKGNSSARLTHLTSSGSAHMVNIPPPIPDANAKSSQFSPAQSLSGLTHKPATSRVAIALSTIRFSNPTPTSLIRTSLLKKGDVLGVARIAGIMGAKETSRLIPLCHNIPISGVDIGVAIVEAGDTTPPEASTLNASTEISEANNLLAPILAHELKLLAGAHGGVVITARVHTFGQTGVEMEALTAASVAGLTVYDMCKAVDKGMRMNGVRVVLKKGGKSGGWAEDENGVVTRVE